MNKLIVKDNALIEASYALDTVEQRIILLAILAARETKTHIEKGSLLSIHASQYIEVFGVEKQGAYQALKNGVKGLYDAGFHYSLVDDKGIVKTYKSRWVEKIGYAEKLAVVELAFASDVIPLITELEKRFTQYDIAQVAGLQSRYAVRLYEMLIQWRSTGKTPDISLVSLREKLGLLAHEYQSMGDFKKRVLDLAIRQINAHTDITAQYQQYKAGRTIAGFTFTFTTKTKKSTQTSEDDSNKTAKSPITVSKLSDAQLARVVSSEQFKADYGHLVSPQSIANHNAQEWIKEMTKRLKKDMSQFQKRPLNDYLKG